MNYFNKLPLITYNNNVAVNIMARAKLSDEIKGDRRLFLPYTISEGDRSDLLAQAYYGNPGYSWLVWYSNEVIDPYYDLPLTELDLQDLIISKYGSIELAQRKIIHYRTNGKNDDRVLAINEYSNLPYGQQKYWEPVLDYLLNVKQYKRKDEVQIISTNRLASISITGLTGEFKIGEEVQYNGTNYGFCTFSSAAELTVKNVTGQFTIDTVITGRESGAQATIIACNNTLSTTQAYDEAIYWEAVSYYDYEIEENEKKKEILLMDNRYSTQVEQDLKRLMQAR